MLTKINDPSNVTKESSLFELYMLSWKFPASIFNLVVTVLFSSLLIMYVFLQWGHVEILASLARSFVDLGLNFAISMLGFLVAGFTIYLTITKVEVFVRMAEFEYEKTGESYLKYNLSCFMVVFAHFILYLFVCIIFKIFAAPHGLLPFFMGAVSGFKGCFDFGLIFYRIPVAVFFVVFGGWTIYLVLLLKSFIFNIYHVIATSIRWELERPDRDA